MSHDAHIKNTPIRFKTIEHYDIALMATLSSYTLDSRAKLRSILNTIGVSFDNFIFLYAKLHLILNIYRTLRSWPTYHETEVQKILGKNFSTLLKSKYSNVGLTWEVMI